MTPIIFNYGQVTTQHNTTSVWEKTLKAPWVIQEWKFRLAFFVWLRDGYFEISLKDGQPHHYQQQQKATNTSDTKIN